MTDGLRSEIKQTRPFANLQEETYLNIVRTAAVLEHRFAEMLREFGVTATQYNVLRILRGAEPHGLCRNEVRDRLVAQVPDTTRLLDRMMEMGLVIRARESDDRRYVTARITARGQALLEKIREPLTRAQKETFQGVQSTDLRFLIDLLQRIRA